MTRTHSILPLLAASLARSGHVGGLIAVRDDPLSDVTLLERPSFVMKGGTVYRSATAADSAAAQ